MKHEELTKDIIGAAMTVLNELKPGIDEKLYENALVIELEHRGHIVEQQREFPVHYREQFIGKLVPDLIVDDRVIADPKVVAVFNDTHMAQMLGYLPELISIAAGCVSTFTRMAPEERYALTDQVRRSARSIGANIAEAWAKRRYAAHFLSKLTDADGLWLVKPTARRENCRKPCTGLTLHLDVNT